MIYKNLKCRNRKIESRKEYKILLHYIIKNKLILKQHFNNQKKFFRIIQFIKVQIIMKN